MGKTHQKFIKKEKSKVKLKGTKKLLPKGQNLTDTNFKVKKIIIKDQVKPHDQGEVLTSRKLNTQELLTRLGHHNVNMKKEALEGLNELIIGRPSEVIRSFLSQLIQSLAKLILDPSGRIRKETVKVLANILSKTEHQQLEPFFPSMSSYLICGLTHIDCAIREDSLFYLDILLKYIPKICAKSGSRILLVCLDLVSHSNSINRTLSINLESSSTSMKWRIKVLSRIRLVLTALNFNLTGSDEELDKQKLEISNKEKDFPSFFRINECILSKLQLDCLGREDNSFVEESLKDFSDAIIPLLLDMFLEIVPQKEDNVGISSDVCTVVSEEVMDILKNIVEILQLLWNVLSKEENSEEKLNSISKKHGDAILLKLVKGKFPYALRTSKKCKVSADCVQSSEKNDKSCKLVNLSLCKLIILFGSSSSWNYIIPFLKNMFRSADTLNNNECHLFTSCISNICHGNKLEESKYFLNHICKTVMTSNSLLSDHFFSLLIEETLIRDRVDSYSESSYVAWLESLPNKLTKSKVTVSVLDKICQISARNYSPFSTSLDSLIEAILDNIPRIQIDGIDTEKGQMKIATLLYYVKEWDQEMIDGLHKAIKNVYWGPKVTAYIKNILNLKLARLESFTEEVDDEQ